MSGRIRRRTAVVGAVAIVLIALAAVAVVVVPGDRVEPGIGSTVRAGHGPPVPAQGAYFGVAVTPKINSTQQGRIESTAAFQASISARWAVAHVYVPVGTPVGTASTLHFLKAGMRLLVSMAIPDTREIISGAQDAEIISVARQIAALHVPVFLEPRWEMDRPNLAGSVHSPADFIAAWVHIRAVFAAHHATNMSWVWCPLAKGFPTGRAQRYYPGDDEVDWVCADGYPDTANGAYQSFASLFQPFLTWASGHHKPIMIGEFGVPLSYGSRRAQWLAAAAEFVKSQPDIKALLYFDGPSSAPSATLNYALEGDAAALRALSSIARDRYFSGVK